MPNATTTGRTVEIAIRPENIRLQRPQGAEGADQRATVTEFTFLGSIIEYHVALEDGTVLRVQTHPLEQFAIGDGVAVRIDASQCTVFDAPGAPTATTLGANA